MGKWFAIFLLQMQLTQSNLHSLNSGFGILLMSSYIRFLSANKQSYSSSSSWIIRFFIKFQYQSFNQHCSKMAKKKEEELEVLRNNTNLWNVHQILNVLHSLVEKSNINVLLEDDSKDPGEFGSHDLYKYLGYFSLIGLLRLHSLHGDYHLALKVIERIDFNSEVFWMLITIILNWSLRRDCVMFEYCTCRSQYLCLFQHVTWLRITMWDLPTWWWRGTRMP